MSLNTFSDAATLSYLANTLQDLGEKKSPRTEQELFYTPRPQIVSAGICRYTIEMSRWRLPISLPLNEIQKLRDRLAIYDWQLIDGVPADSAKILATADRFVALGGVK